MLESCPFCGGKAIQGEHNECFGHGDYRRIYTVRCKDCFATISMDESQKNALIKVVKAWNKRIAAIPKS